MVKAPRPFLRLEKMKTGIGEEVQKAGKENRLLQFPLPLK